MHRRGRQERGRNVTKVHAKVFAGTKSGTPEAGGKNFIEAQNPTGLKLVTAYVAPSLAVAKPDEKIQFEWFGYLVADRMDHLAGVKPVLNTVTGLKDSRAK